MSNTHEPMTSRAALVRDLAEVLNRHSAENRSKTPDFVLAEYLVRSLEALDHTFNERARWYGRWDAPGPGGDEPSCATEPEIGAAIALVEMAADLRQAANVFRRYEEQHRAKGTAESLEKANRNGWLAARFENTLNRMFVRVLKAASLPAAGPSEQDTQAATPPDKVNPCAGERCMSTDGRGHSRECIEEAARVQGWWPPTWEDYAKAGPSAPQPARDTEDSPPGLPTMADDAAALRTAAEILMGGGWTEKERAGAHTIIRAISRRLGTNSYGALERKQATPAFSIRLTSDKSVELSGFSERMAIKHDSGQVGGWRLVGPGDTFTFARKYSIDDLCDVLVGRMIAEGMDRVTRIVPAGDTSFMICVAKNAPPNKIDA